MVIPRTTTTSTIPIAAPSAPPASPSVPAAEAALSGQPDAVAGRAKGLRDGGDEPDPTRRAVREFELGGRRRPVLGDGDEGEEVFDLLLDALRRHHQVLLPDPVGVQWHELD